MVMHPAVRVVALIPAQTTYTATQTNRADSLVSGMRDDVLL